MQDENDETTQPLPEHDSAPDHDHGPTWQAELIRFLILIGVFVVVIAVIAWSRPYIFDQVVPSVLGIEGSTVIVEPVDATTTGVGGIEHVVQEGEDLMQIAQRYGVTAGAILAANEMADGTAVQPGTTLFIPLNE